MNRRLFLGVAMGAAAAATLPQPAFAFAPGAAEAVAKAAAGAKAEGKQLLLVFHASWCAYCQLMDIMLADKACKPIIEKYFVVFHLRALEEKPEMLALQLDGADAYYASLTPKKSGLPYTAVLNGEGARVVDSIMPTGDNFGFPVDAVELANFEEMMRKGGVGMTQAEARTLRATCVKIMRSH